MPEMFISFVTRYLANFGRRLMPDWVKSETSQRFRQTSIAAPTTISPLSKRAFSSEGAILWSDCGLHPRARATATGREGSAGFRQVGPPRSGID